MGIIIEKLTFGFTENIIEDLSCSFDSGWTAVVGANGAGKTTLINLITGRLNPDDGKIRIRGSWIYCSQITDNIPAEVPELMDDNSSEAYKLKTRFGIGEDWPDRWHNLSFGEQKRMQIASALYMTPEILILDEPSNHLDYHSRELLMSALSSFRGTGIIISHDRRFLDSLPYQTLFLDPPFHDLRSQTYSAARQEREKEESWRRVQREKVNKEVKKLERRASQFRNLASSADKRKSKKNIAGKDHDAKSAIDAARITGKDAVHGKLMNQLQGRIRQEHDKLDRYTLRRRAAFDFSLRFEPSRNKTLFMIKEGEIRMGEKRLRFNDFELNAQNKAALTGVNGSGKSTLLNHIYTSCRTDKTLYMPQEISSRDTKGFFRRLSNLDSIERGTIFSIMAALGSDPQRVLDAEKPSPGEIRKLMIADAIRNRLELLILDEPTNHLDLPSIEALEQALQDYKAGLVLVSHDSTFLENTTGLKWKISESSPDDYILNIHAE